MSKNNMFITFGVPAIGEDEIKAISEVIKSKWVGFGSKCLEFEDNFSQFTGSPFSKSVNSGTSALHLGLCVVGVKKGDEVITTPLTFAATVRAIEFVGATPVLVDIDPETFNLDPAKLRAVITKKTKAIIPVHFAGMPCDMEQILAAAKEYGLHVIEDAAHAIGAEFQNRKIGFSESSITCFSFYPNKNITSIEGGMITTSNQEYAEKVEILRMTGQSTGAWKRYSQTKDYVAPETIAAGFKYNMTDINAAVGLVQLAKLENFLKIRERHAKIYDEGLGNFAHIGLQKRSILGRQTRHALHFYPIVLKEGFYRCGRDSIVSQIRERGVGVVVHYKPIHEHPYFSAQNFCGSKHLEISEKIARNIISLPLGPSCKDDDIYSTIKIILDVLNSNLI